MMLAKMLAAGLAIIAVPAGAQQYGVYLHCAGKVESGGKSMPGQVDLALRRNSQLAMIQSSDILPAGEKLQLEITPQFYTMTFQAPVRNSVLYYDWLRGAMFVWNPDLKRLHTIRMSVDRQSAALQGDMLDGAGAMVGRLAMRCEPKNNDTVEEPKF
jgi:hypothetical protein